MLRTKKDVDKHVRSTLSKLREDERNLRGYRIAQLYFNIGEYNSALEYIQRYIQANDKNAAAYKVLGQCYEKLKRPDKQLFAYQRSLELDKKQSDLLIEICKLLQNNDLSDVTPAKARHWYELAESRGIHDPAVLNLKLKFTDGTDQGIVQDMILKEIVRRPLDIGLHTRLVDHFLQQNRIDEAFKYVLDIEMKPNNKFRNSTDWYAAVSAVLEKYKAKNAATLNKNWTYWLQLISSIERQLFLTLTRSPKDVNAIDYNLLEATNLLFELDQNLNKVATACSFPDSERDLFADFLIHFRGQFALHAASLLFKRAIETSVRANFLETTKTTLPLLLLAFNFGTIDGNQLWLRNASEATKRLIDLWQAQSSFRVLQVARTLQSCISSGSSTENAVLANLRKICTDKYSVWSNKDDVLNEIRSIVADSDWRKKLYRNLFVTNKEHQNAVSGSHLVKSSAFEKPTFEWPDKNKLNALELKAQEADPSNLSHLVYLTLGNSFDQTEITIEPDFKCGLFQKLKYSTKNLINCSADTLNQLDIHTFLFAATLQTKRSISMNNTLLGSNVPTLDTNKPKMLPYTNMANILATEEQSEWWTAAYKICNNIGGEELGALGTTLVYGIEAVRGVGSTKMDLIILLNLGKVLSSRVDKTMVKEEREFLEDRVEALFKFSLYVFRVQNSSRSSSEPFRRLFKYVVGNNYFEIEQDVNKLAEEAITFLAGRYFKNNAYEECIEDLAGIKLPFATYFQAESYRKMTEVSDTPKKNKRTYLDKARDYLKQTVDLLEGPNIERNHPLKSIIDEDIKRLQNETRKFETNQSMSDSFVSANGRSDLEESERETATPVPNLGYNNIERLIRKIMESLNILTSDVNDVRYRVQHIEDDVTDVRNRVQNIEENFNKEDIDDVETMDDNYLNLELHNQNQNLNNTSMIVHPNRSQTLNQQTPKSSQMPNTAGKNSFPTSHQHQMGLNNSFGNMSTMMNNMYGTMPLNPSTYQAALINAAVSQSPQMAASNYSQPPMLPYSNDMYALQALYAQQMLGEAHNPNLMASMMMQHQPQQQHNHPLSNQPAAQQYAMGSPSASSIASSVPQSYQQSTPLNSFMKPGTSASQTPPQNQWNTSIKNTPVEKAPPVNVVITSSDPLPQNLSAIPTQSSLNFSVTIPPQHIKNNPTTSTFGAASANPTITAALQDKKITQSPIHMNVSAKTITSTATAPTTQEQKTIFGNLSSKPLSSTPFSSPTIKLTSDLKQTETPTSEAAKPNPFASFSFGVQSSVASSTANQSKPFSFSSSIGQLKKTETSALVNAATPETPKHNQNDANTSANSAKDDEDDYEPTAHFEPVIPLPELVDVKTGEENETILFEHRAKLLRYVKELKEWKERGIGNMKVMVSKDDPNKVRLLMRREQVLKLCCNQLLAKNTKFNKMPNTETALTWFGQDYSENELQVEMLAIRFKTAEICKQFYATVLSAQANMTDGRSQPVKSSSIQASAVEKPSNKVDTTGFGDKFKPKPGSWSCKSCYTQNTAESVYCACCEEPKDDTVPKKEKANILGSTNATTSKFSFGTLSSAMGGTKVAGSAAPPTQSTSAKNEAAKSSDKGFGDQFKPKPGSWSCKACYTSNASEALHCACCEEPKDDTIPKKEKANIFGSSNAGASKFSFGNLGSAQSTAPTFSFTFGSQNLTATTTPAPTFNATEPSVPQIDSKKEFNFVFKGKSPGKQALNTTQELELVSDDENVEEEENTAYFAPVIPLPDKVEVKTGEEDENILYSHRAKLFRFRNSEWRERGLGDIKILQHKQTGQLRVVMRREQVHKICLNHILTSDIEYKVKDPKSWQFIANDFSEGTYELDNFSLRFKTEDISKDFKRAIDAALSGNAPKINGNDNDQTDTVANEESKRLAELKLPNNYYDYNKNEDCKGCRGCRDDFVFSEVKHTNFGQFDDNPLPLSPPSKVELAHNDLSKDTKKVDNKNSFSFASVGNDSASNGFSFSSTANNTTSTGMFFGSSSFKSPFSAATTTNEKKDSTNTTPVFGQSNLFGGNVVKTSSAEPAKSTPVFSFGVSTPAFGNNGEKKSPFSLETATSTNQDKPTESKPLFGSTATFGTNNVITSPATNLFGGSTNGTNDTFGFKLPASTTVTPFTTNQTSSPNTDTAQKPSVFGSATGMSFADLAKSNGDNSEPFSSSSTVSFAALAQNSSNGSTTFGKSTPTGGFFGLSNKDTFSNLMAPQNGTNGNNQNSTPQIDDGENHTEDANYDPHYDPIIALPDEIQVSTGEENEEKLFSERAKLYRFDSVNKEWKERGVGEFKVLHHPVNNSYRLLLRREQIHKLVLNMALSADLQINFMKQSDKAFIWVGQNFAEEQENGELESLSVRFKNADLATKFNNVVQSCIENLKAR
ncbi:E3 SUMO-protein ligase RanBP2-like [Contarinia nasturtii]|uniref:E3 SUMO-protein ligase RanBP2-like n=1 Tax=Contarinia nasturtii TaxID=265458 RepID=UPI0012D4743B|nr:E3 SUMO-protein ligase RanBP2-like [Contarinia nasturtii]